MGGVARLRRGCLVGCVLVGCSVDPSPSGTLRRSVDEVQWTVASPPGVVRSGHTATLLAGGKVLVTGGTDGTTGRDSATVFDPATNEWAPTKPMAERRGLHCAARRPDGSVVVVGGITSSATTVTASADLFDPATATFSKLPSLAVGRRRHACVALASGAVLVVGGEDATTTALASAELLEVGASAWKTLAPMNAVRQAPQLALAGDGRVVAAGAKTADVYDPKTSVWTAAPSAIPEGSAAVALSDGRVLVAGYGAGTSVVFDPSTSAWKSTKPMAKARAGLTGTRLSNGQVLALGGLQPPSKLLPDAELFDPVTGAWTTIEPMRAERLGHTATLLDDGRVLVVGGASGVTIPPPELFNAPNGVSCATNDVCASGLCRDGRCCDTACNGACEACDVKGKEGTCSPIDGAPRAAHASCTPYTQCVAGACGASCASDADCTKGNLCFTPTKRCAPEKGLCDGDRKVLHADGTVAADCGAYACTPAGECNKTCGTTLDCARGFACEGTTCVAVAAPEPVDPGCSTSRRPGGAQPLFLLVLGALLGRRALRRLGFLFGGVVGCHVESAPPVEQRSEAATYVPGGLMQNNARIYHSMTALDDGRVLVVGGLTKAGTVAELYDPKPGTWSLASATATAHANHTATKLADGRVVVIGGQSATAATEIYDPVANGWSKLASPATRREEHESVLLADGRVLVIGGRPAGGSPTAKVEIFDPATGAFTAAASMATARSTFLAVRLKDGRVYVNGGLGVSAAELYDPTTDTWTKTKPLPKARDTHAGALLADGGVLVVGGQDPDVLRWDPTSDTFGKLGALADVRLGLTITPLLDGRVFVAGGTDATESFPTAATALVDPTAGTVTPFTRLLSPRSSHRAALLPEGRVLLVGGVTIFDLSDPVLAVPEVLELMKGHPCTEASQCASGFCTDGRCCDRGCTEACSACNVAGKEGTCSPIEGRPLAGHETCAPYGTCSGGGCVGVCASDADCSTDHVCDVATHACVEPKATCDGLSTVTDKASSLTRDCAPYRCRSNGTCVQRCTTSDDCVGGSACAGNRCEAAAPAGPDCSLQPTGPGRGPGLLGAAFVFVATLGLARRRPR